MWRDELICASREDLIECIMEQRHIIEHLERRIIQLELRNNKMSEQEETRTVNDNFANQFLDKEHLVRRCTPCSRMAGMSKNNIINRTHNADSRNLTDVISSTNSSPSHVYREKSVHKPSQKESQNVMCEPGANLHTSNSVNYNCLSHSENNKNNNNYNVTPKQFNHVYNVHKYTQELDVVDGIIEIERVLRLHNAGTPRLPDGVVSELLYIRRKLKESEEAKRNLENVRKIEEEQLQLANTCKTSSSGNTIVDGQVATNHCRQPSQLEEDDNVIYNNNHRSDSNNVHNIQHRLSFHTPVNRKEFITLHRPRTNVWGSVNENQEERYKGEYERRQERQEHQRSLFINTPSNKHNNSNLSQTKHVKTQSVQEKPFSSLPHKEAKVQPKKSINYTRSPYTCVNVTYQ